MASIGFVKSLLNGLSNSKDRGILDQIFDHILREQRIGDSDKAENFAWFAVESTTHATANTEFSVLHGMDSTPTRFIPSLRLDVPRPLPRGRRP